MKKKKLVEENSAYKDGWKDALKMIKDKIFEDYLHSAGDVAYFIDVELKNEKEKTG